MKIKEIYKRMGIADVDFSHYAAQCFICGNRKCANNRYDNIEACDRYSPLKTFNEWYTELQAVIYHSETPYGNDDGSIDEGTDATSDILSELKRDECMLMPMIEAWATGDKPYECYERMLEDMRP